MIIKMPMQPIKDGRFESNPIVDWLCTEVSDMNKISIWCQENDIDNKHQEQLAQLVGYSVSGYGSLSYVSDDSYEEAATVVATGMTEYNHLQTENERLREENKLQIEFLRKFIQKFPVNSTEAMEVSDRIDALKGDENE